LVAIVCEQIHMLAEIDLTMLRTGHRGVAYLITKCGRHRSSQSSGAANAVLETQESTLLRVVTRQLQVVNGESRARIICSSTRRRIHEASVAPRIS